MDLVAPVASAILVGSIISIPLLPPLNIVFRFEENRDKEAVFDRDKDHEMARKVAEETIVLLKNEGIIKGQCQRVLCTGI